MRSSLCKRVDSFSPEARSLDALGLTSSCAEELARDALEQAVPADWQPTGLSSAGYLDVMERIVRVAAGWQDERGAMIDPYRGGEHGQTSPRFAAPGAILLAFGRAEDLAPSIFKTMGYACDRLADAESTPSADFWMRELATAFACLEEVGAADQLSRWRAALASVVPEATYLKVSPDGTDLETLHNWTVYAAGGEWLREAFGIGGPEDAIWGRRFFDKYMAAQRVHFTEHGMYRDPGEPITYDITTRLQIATALAFGYDGELRADYEELLRRGGFATLLMTSADGYAPYGGRSNQFQFQEAIIAALCELEARRYKAYEPRLAAAFKRQARLALASGARWLAEMTPFRHIKNGFPPEEQFGIDPYGVYSVYSLLVASFYGLAALFADDEIEEGPCPAEIGDYVFRLDPSFHKVFANTRGSMVELDTAADFHHDATGLGRFLVGGTPIELGPGAPICSHPHATLPDEYTGRGNYAIGPEWQVGDEWLRLAELNEGLESELTDVEAADGTVAFVVVYRHADSDSVVRERYRLTAGQLHVDTEVQVAAAPVSRLRFYVPTLISDGDACSTIVEAEHALTLGYRGATWRVNWPSGAEAELKVDTCANRNGLYRCLCLTTASPSLSVRITLAPSAPSQ